MKKVLLVTDGIFHPPLLGRWALHASLRRLEGFSFSHISSLEKLPNDLESFSALALHYHHKTISDAALKRLDGFVKNGGGILALHAATASFKKTLPYFEILGGRFIGHGKVERFKVEKVKVKPGQDLIFNGMKDFFLYDELYVHELSQNIQVHFTARHDDRNLPVVWTHHYGKGRVCYFTGGHTFVTMETETVHELLQRGLKWVTE